MRGRVVRGYGILQPRVSVSLASASESRFAAVYAGHPGRRSIHDRRVGRVSGSVRRRHVHGEGHLRRRGLSSRHGRTLSRQQPAQPRSPRGNVRARRARHRRRSLRRLSDALSHVDATNAPMDSRRLAVASLADVARSGTGRLQPRSAVDALALEDRRQHAPQRDAGRAARLARRRPDAASRIVGRVDRPSRSSAFGTPWIAPLLFAAARPPREQAWRPYYAAIAHDGSRALQQLGLAVVLLPDQALLADRRDRSHRRSACCAPDAGCSSGRPRRTREETTGNSRLSVWRRMWPAVLLGAAILSFVAWRGEHRSGRTDVGVVGIGRRVDGIGARLAARAGGGDGAQRAAHAPKSRARRPTSARRRCAMRRVTGATSIASSPRKRTGSRPTTSRKRPSRSSRRARRRRTSVCNCSRRRPPAIWDFSRAAR